MGVTQPAGVHHLLALSQQHLIQASRRDMADVRRMKNASCGTVYDSI